ncbi:MAG: hypothetical protein ABSC92_16130 [Rhizomicrobium sp.]|jgi:hypothetical protein
MPEPDSLGEERRLIFENVANGVPIETIMAAFRRSRLEIQKEVEFVARKITEYRFRRLTDGPTKKGAPATARPLVACGTYADIRFHRVNLLETLSKLGNLYLSSPLLLPKVTIQKVDSPDAVREVSHRVNHS